MSHSFLGLSISSLFRPKQQIGTNANAATATTNEQKQTNSAVNGGGATQPNITPTTAGDRSDHAAAARRPTSATSTGSSMEGIENLAMIDAIATLTSSSPSSVDSSPSYSSSSIAAASILHPHPRSPQSTQPIPPPTTRTLSEPHANAQSANIVNPVAPIATSAPFRPAGVGQRRAISEPVSAVSSVLSALGLNLPENLNCHRPGAARLAEEDSSDESDDDIIYGTADADADAAADQQRIHDSELASRMGSDVGIHKSQADPSVTRTVGSGIAPLGLTHLLPPPPPTTSSHPSHASAHAVSASVKAMLRKAQAAGYDAMLKSAGGTMPPSMRTALEKSLIQYKNDSRSRETSVTSPTPLTRTQSTQPGLIPSNPTSPILSASPSVSTNTSPRGVDPALAYAHAVAAASSLPSAHTHNGSAMSAPTTARREGEPELMPLSRLTSNSTSAHPTPVAGVNHLSPLSPSMSSIAATLAAEDGHWSTQYSSRRTRKVVKKPSLSSSSTSSSTSDLPATSLLTLGSAADLIATPAPAPAPTAAVASPARSQSTSAIPTLMHPLALPTTSNGEWKRIDVDKSHPLATSTPPNDSASSSSATTIPTPSGGISGGLLTVMESLVTAASAAVRSPSTTTATSAPGGHISPHTLPPAAAHTPVSTPTPTPVSSAPSGPPSGWSVSEVVSFLVSIGLTEHAPRFEKSLIDGELLLSLNEDDFNELGVRDRFHRRKISRRLAALGETITPANEPEGNTHTTHHQQHTGAELAHSRPPSGSGRLRHSSSHSSPFVPPPVSSSSAHRSSRPYLPHPPRSSSSVSGLGFTSIDSSPPPTSSDEYDESPEPESAPNSGIGAHSATANPSPRSVFESVAAAAQQYQRQQDELYVSQHQVADMLRTFTPYQQRLAAREAKMQEAQRHTASAATAAAAAAVGSGSRRSSRHKQHTRQNHQPVAHHPSDPYHEWTPADDEMQRTTYAAPTSASASSSSSSSSSPPAAASAAVVATAIPPLPPSTSSPSHHLRIIDLKEIESLQHLNEGTAGVAFVGQFKDQRVVVKQPKKLRIGSEEWLELQLHMSIPAHPHIIPFIGICMVQLQMYLVTRFIERGSLKSLLSAKSCDGGDELRRYYSHPLQLIRAACEIASALSHLHASHIVHRDVAARNVLVTAEGTHILSDFGLSRRMEPNGNNQSNEENQPHDDEVYTMHSLTALPARWTAPESLQSQQFTAASDVYSLGILMYEMLTGGALPYAHVKDNLHVIAGVIMNDLELDFPPHSPPIVVDFIRRAMQPIDTRPNINQIKKDMETWLRDEITKQASKRKDSDLGIEMVAYARHAREQ